MASFGLARAAANTSPGNQTFTDAGMAATPNAALFLMTRALTDGAAADQSMLTLGAAVSTTARWAYCYQSEHNVASSNVNHVLRGDACLYSLTAAGLADARADFVSFGPGAVTVNWINAPASAYLVTVVLFEVPNAYAGTYHDGGAAVGGTFTVTPNFQTDWMIVAGTHLFDLNTITSTGPNRSSSIGVCSGALAQYALQFIQPDALSPTALLTRVAANRIRRASSHTGVSPYGHEVTAIGATTITMTQRENATTSRLNGILALDLPADQAAYVGLFTSPTATGSAGETGPNFPPALVMFLLSLGEAVDTNYTDSRAGTIGLSAFSAADEFANTVSDEDAVTTSNTQSLSDDQAVYLPDDDGSAILAASFVSMDPTGFTLNWSVAPATAKVFPLVAFQSAPTTVALDTLSLVSSAAGLTVMPGAVSVLLDVLSLLGSPAALSVVPGSTLVLLDTLSLALVADSLSVSLPAPDAITILMDTLVLDSTLLSMAVWSVTNMIDVVLLSRSLGVSLVDRPLTVVLEKI